MTDDPIEAGREFLRDTVRQTVDFTRTDQSRGVPPPPLEKPPPREAERIALPPQGTWAGVAAVDVAAAIRERRSHRKYLARPLTLDHLAFLLWATQGIREVIRPGTALRTVPSAGARHALETYIAATRVDGLEAGIYRFLPVEHELVREARDAAIGPHVVKATLGQTFAGGGAATFIWTALPYRMEWRYGAAAHKVIALDAGHVCQNLYLACACIGAGACAVAAYDQAAVDLLIGVDGRDEFAVYLATVGYVDQP